MDCNKDDGPNTILERLQIVSVDLPDTFMLGKSYEIGVTYNRPDSCTHFQGFNVNPIDQNTRVKQAIAAANDDQMCPEKIIEETDKCLFEVVY